MLDIIKKLIEHVTGECNKIDREEAFDNMLDNTYFFEKVGGPFAYMIPSNVLKECDPIAYRCGVNDMEDAENWIEINEDYYDAGEIDKAREEFISDLESEISDLSSEIEELEEEKTNGIELDILRESRTKKEKELEEVEKYSF